jgi:hypothetical protein
MLLANNGLSEVNKKFLSFRINVKSNKATRRVLHMYLKTLHKKVL